MPVTINTKGLFYRLANDGYPQTVCGGMESLITDEELTIESTPEQVQGAVQEWLESNGYGDRPNRLSGWTTHLTMHVIRFLDKVKANEEAQAAITAEETSTPQYPESNGS